MRASATAACCGLRSSGRPRVRLRLSSCRCALGAAAGFAVSRGCARAISPATPDDTVVASDQRAALGNTAGGPARARGFPACPRIIAEFREFNARSGRGFGRCAPAAGHIGCLRGGRSGARS